MRVTTIEIIHLKLDRLKDILHYILSQTKLITPFEFNIHGDFILQLFPVLKLVAISRMTISVNKRILSSLRIPVLGINFIVIAQLHTECICKLRCEFFSD